MNPKVFFLLLFLYQIVFIFQGLELSDQGFYATFYQQIFTNPEGTQYNFMFWFSGIVGGAYNYLFDWLGLWGIRLAGVLVTTSTIIITYNLLKKYLNTGYLKLGLVLVLLFINNNLKEIHYNDLSALFNILIISLLFNGLKENKPGKLFLAGLFVSLCAFTRLPNILSLGLGLGIFYYGYHAKNSFKVQIRQAFIFGGGFIFMTAIILGIMKQTGHLEIFLNSIKVLSSMGKEDVEGFYGPMVLIKNFIGAYSSSIKYTLFILIAITAGAFIVKLFKKQSFYRKWIVDIFKYGIVLFSCFLVIKGYINNEIVLYFFSGIIIITSVLIIFTTANTDIKFLTLAGFFIFLTYPFSSSASLFSVGRYSLWLSFPIAINYLFNIRYVDSLRVAGKTFRFGPLLSFPETQLKEIRKFTIIVCAFACLYYTYYYPYFDNFDRRELRYAVNHKYLRGIYTSKQRARSINEFLEESAKYIKPGDIVLAYQSIPMFHYLTETKPYLRNSMPYFYDAGYFRDELDSTYAKTKMLPVAVQHLKKMGGKAGNWPDPPPFYDAPWYKINAPRDSVFNNFLKAHNYTKVWTNGMFEIFLPPKDSL
jgi:hypothetical protein